jgi:hypothetical protein
MFFAVLVKIAKTANQSKINDIKKIWYVNAQYYSSFKKRKAPLFGTTLMILKDSMLSEISQAQKDKYHTISLISGILKRQTHRSIE